MLSSTKCQHCNNKTTDPSGNCHLHQNGPSKDSLTAEKAASLSEIRPAGGSGGKKHTINPTSTYDPDNDEYDDGNWVPLGAIAAEADEAGEYDDDVEITIPNGDPHSFVAKLPYVDPYGDEGDCTAEITATAKRDRVSYGMTISNSEGEKLWSYQMDGMESVSEGEGSHRENAEDFVNYALYEREGPDYDELNLMSP